MNLPGNRIAPRADLALSARARTPARSGRAFRRLRSPSRTAWLLLACWLVLAPSSRGAAAPCGLEGRPAFAGHTLPLDGPPDPPSMQTVDAFPSLPSFAYPVFLTGAGDGTNRLFVVQQDGRIWTFPNDPAAGQADLSLYLDLSSSGVAFTPGSETGLLGLAFDPAFATNGVLYVDYTYVDQSACTYLATRVERITVPDPTANHVDSAAITRTPLVEICQPQLNHNGGMLAFGPDGMLYVSTGDGGAGGGPAADLGSPLGSILRIDPVNGTAPPDNPFIATLGADPRIYHLGLRNPWRFSFDRSPPHDLWIGDVGEDSWEEVDRVPAVQGGVDFGWPACEGTHDLGGACTARGDVLPVIELPHVDAFSITGGYVYRGAALPQLQGLYVFGDYVTGRVWAWDGVTVDPATGVAALIDLAQLGNLSSFGEDDAGELYLLDYVPGRILRLEPAPGGGTAFPTRLSETGLFLDTPSLTPAAGVVEYDVNAPLWSDRALKRRWLALPAGSQVGFAATGDWSFPVGTVFVKQFDLPLDVGVTRRLETRLFIHQIPGWTGVTYRWNEAQTDATLLRTALSDTFTVVENGQTFDQKWLYPSPSGCLGCHTLAAGRVLGVRTAQLNRDFPYPGGDDGQLDAWSCSGIFSVNAGDQPGLPAHPPLDDLGASRQQRARAYLDSNCAMCHQPGGTAPGGIDMRSTTWLDDMHLIGVAPNQGGLGLPSPERIKPGVSDESVLIARMETDVPGLRMASGTLLPHAAALAVLRDWIDLDLFAPDTDEDGVPDTTDLCPGTPDPLQTDRDGDGIGDACDPDDAPELQAAASGPARASAGALTTPVGSVHNAGLRTAPSSQIRFYLSSDPTFDPALDAPIGDCQSGPVATGTTVGCSDPEARVPADLLPVGTVGELPFYWLACADALGVVDETDEGNNCALAQQVVLVPEPDLLGCQLSGLAAVAWLVRRTRRGQHRGRAQAASPVH